MITRAVPAARVCVRRSGTGTSNRYPARNRTVTVSGERPCGESHLRLKFTQREIGIPLERTDAARNRRNRSGGLSSFFSSPSSSSLPFPARTYVILSLSLAPHLLLHTVHFVSSGRARIGPSLRDSAFDIAFSVRRDPRDRTDSNPYLPLDPFVLPRSLPLYPYYRAFLLHSVDWFSSTRPPPLKSPRRIRNGRRKYRCVQVAKTERRWRTKRRGAGRGAKEAVVSLLFARIQFPAVFA